MAEEQKWAQEAVTNHVLCANNCGFFGSSTTLNLCSKCYKDHCLKERNISTAKIAVEQSLTSDHALISSSHAPSQNRFESESAEIADHALSSNQFVSESSDQALNLSHAPPSNRFESESSSSEVVSAKVDIERSLTLSHAPPSDRFGSETTDLVVNNAAVTPSVQKRNRCGSCSKRVGLTGFTCRCGTTFCGTHRYPEKHACSFDFKAMGKEAIARENPVVKAAKLDKI